MDSLNYDDFKHICRICLLPCEQTFLLDFVISRIYYMLTGFQFETNDKLPQQICHKCSAKIIEIDAFALQSKEAHSSLMKCLNKYKNEGFNKEQEVVEETNELIKIKVESNEFVESELNLKEENFNLNDFNEDTNTTAINEFIGLNEITTEEHKLEFVNVENVIVDELQIKTKNADETINEMIYDRNPIQDDFNEIIVKKEMPHENKNQNREYFKRRAKHFSIEDKERILNIFKVCCEQNPNNNKTENVTFTAKAAGICVTSVHKILRQYNKEHRLDPPKVYCRKRAVLDNIDDQTKSKLRRLVHNFVERNEPPTLNKIMAALHEADDMPHLKRTTLSLLLKEIEFNI